MKVNKVNAKNIIIKSKLPETDYVINPYTGCSNGCIYCYARFMKVFTGHKEKWGNFVDIKINSPELILNSNNKYEGKKILISSVTDPYLIQEKKYRITRQILENLVKLNPKIEILTKSDLVLRDLDILKKFDNIKVGFSITTLDENIRKTLEPNTAKIINRINALRILNKSNIKTYVFIGPIFPYITDWKKIIENTKDFVDLYMFENLNIKGSIFNDIKKWLKNHNQDLIKKYNDIYYENNSYWDDIQKKIENFCKMQNKSYKIFINH